MALTKRLVKGSAITAAEHDANLDHVLDRANHTGDFAFTDLTDVEAGTPAEGEIPVLRSGVWTFEAKPASGSNPALDDITDWPAGVTATEVGYLDGVTSGIQAQLDAITGAGYITDYTVTEADVTAHEAALSITESQIIDLGAYLVAADVASHVVRVVHGATAGTARPAGATYVEWVGSVEPTNAQNDDTWVDTSA